MDAGTRMSFIRVTEQFVTFEGLPRRAICETRGLRLGCDHYSGPRAPLYACRSLFGCGVPSGFFFLWHSWTELLVVGCVIRAGLRAGWSGVRIPVGTGNFSQTGSGAYPVSYLMGTRDSFPEGKAAGAWSWPLTSI